MELASPHLPRMKSRRSQGWLYGHSRYFPLGWMFFGVLYRLPRIFTVPPPTLLECSLCWVPASQTLRSIVNIQSLPMELLCPSSGLWGSLLLWIYAGAPFQSEPHPDLDKHFSFVPKSSGSRTTPQMAPPLGLPSLQPPAL